MRRGGWISMLVLILLIGVPTAAVADAGTPLMWAGMLHLVFGNALIGIGEGLLLAILFRLGRWKCVLVMIAANYFSAWFGDLFLMGCAVKAPDLDLYDAWRWVWSMVTVTFFLTCILEWPFVFFCLRKSEHRIRKSIWGNVLIQFVSYLLIFGWYWGASGKSLYTQMHIVKPLGFPVPTNAVVYFISNNADVCSLKLPGGNLQKILNLNNTNSENRLFLNRSESGKISIYARLQQPEGAGAVQCIVSNLDVTATVPQYDQQEKLSEIRGNWAPQWGVARIGSATNSPWEFHTGFWAIEGLRGENHNTGQQVHLSLETPFIQWTIRNAYQLPGDCVVFQLGDKQICILDPDTRRVALIAKGYGPVVVLE
jgi:hypothetical protein